jgi:hypothetical protein
LGEHQNFVKEAQVDEQVENRQAEEPQPVVQHYPLEMKKN